MSTPIATVLSVTGQAWARDADGNLRVLEPGDILLEGETLITSDNGRVRLDFGDVEPVAIGPGQVVAMLAELDIDNPVSSDEASATDESIEALLAAIEAGEGDLLEVLDPTAAGLGGGGEGGGHTFVRLARINLDVDSLAYGYQPAQLDGLIEAQGEALALADEIDENGAPIATDDTGLGREGSPLTGNVLANDSDIDGDALTVTEFMIGDDIYQAGDTATIENIGSLTIGTDGSYTFTPVENWNGEVPAVSYTVSDGELSDTATLGLSVTPVNDTPVGNNDNATDAANDALTTPEDTALIIDPATLLANDSDEDGDALFISGVESEARDGDNNIVGTVTTTSDNDGRVTQITFTPNADYNGDATFDYTVNDGAATDTATVMVAVTPVNDIPVGNDDNATSAADDALTTPEDTALVIDPASLLANDSDVDGDELFISGVESEARDGDNNIVGTVTTTSDNDGRVTQITFTPNADYNGDATFDYTVHDGAATDTASVTVAVTPVNDNPVGGDDNATDAANDVLTTPEDTALIIDPATLLANDSDVDGDALFISGVESEARDGDNNIVGTVTTTSDNDGRVTQITFTPNADYNGDATFDYTVNDGAATDTATVTVDVTPANDAPVGGDDNATDAADDALTTPEDTALIIDPASLLANDSDVDGDELFISGVESEARDAQGNVVGTVTTASDNAGRVTQITFTPNADYNGDATFDYTVSDGQETDTASVMVAVTPVNDTPVGNDDNATDAANDALTTPEDTALIIDPATLLANDSDVDGDELFISGVDGEATDAQGNVVGTVTTTSDNDGRVTQITFTPNADYNGDVTFDYSVSDGDAIDTATVTVAVTPVNDTPVGGDDNATDAANDALTTPEDTALIIDPATLLANDSDVDGDALFISGVESEARDAQGNVVGSVTATSDNDGRVTQITFTPNADYNGDATFDYTVSDGAATDTASVTVAVTPVNDIPVGNNDNATDAANDALTTPEDTALIIDPATLLANDSDEDGDALFISGVESEARDGDNNIVGTVTTTSDNAGRVTQITFTPNADYNGDATFDYTVNDGAATDTATVMVAVTPVNDIPVGNNDNATDAANDALTTPEDTALIIDPATLLANDSDVDGDALFISGVESEARDGDNNIVGTVTTTSDNDGRVTQITFTPNADYNGDATFDYTVNDGTATDTATVTVDVTPANDAPVGGDDNATDAADDALTTPEDTALIIDPASLLANDSDVDGDALFISGVESEARDGDNNIVGTVTTTSDNDGRVTQITFMPNADYNGDATFDYTVNDGTATDTATVTVAVTPVNDTPVGGDDNATDAADDALTTLEDTALIIDPATLLANDDDVDGDTLTITAVGNATNGKVTLNDNGTITFTPDENYNGDATFDYTVSDGAATDTAIVTVEVKPDNDAPVALNDINSVDVGGSDAATGNVLNNDSDIDGDPIRVSQVDGEAVADGGSISIDGNYGRLDINSDGGYTYTSNLSTPVLYGFNGSDAQLTGNLLNNFALSSDAQQRVLITEHGVGVTDGEQGHPTPDQINETGDVLVADLGASVSSVTFDVARLFNDESGGESGQWFAYGADGELVGSGQFGPESVAYEEGSNHKGTVTINADDVSGDFQFIAFEGIDYQNGSDNSANDGGDYFITGITVQDAFDYTIVDDQGGDANATLTVDSSASLIGYQTPPDSAAEPETIITINEITGDDVIDFDESQQDVITITGSVGGDAREGDSVTLTVAGNEYPGQVDANNEYSINVPGWALAEDTRIEASISGENATGNSYSADTTRDYTVDLNLPPDAEDDRNTVELGGEVSATTTNGVLSNDTDQNDDDLSVTQVGNTSVSNTGNTLIQGQYGELNINAQGGYTYTSALVDTPRLYGFNQADNSLGDQADLNLANLTYAAQQRVSSTDEGAGVKGGAENRPVPNQINDTGDILVIDLGQSVTNATVSLTHLFENEGGGEIGKWYAYDAEGNYLAEGAIDDSTVDYSSSHEGVFTISDIAGFQYLAFDALPYSEPSDRDGGDYFVKDITVNDVFNYTASDGRGGEDNANLTIGASASLANYEPVPVEQLSADRQALDVEFLGLHGEYYGYNDDRVGSESDGKYAEDTDKRLHADDGSAIGGAHDPRFSNRDANLDTIGEVAAIIEGRAGAILGTGEHAADTATDAEFVATNVDYNINEGLGFGTNVDLGDNPMDESGGVTSGNLYDFLEHGGDEDSLEVTSGLGQTTDGIIRLSGSVYLEEGSYDIRVTGDDGFRLTIGGKEVASFDTITAPITTTEKGVSLSEGFQDIELLYWEQAERSVLKVELKKSGSDDSEYKVLSTDNFALFGEDPRPTLEDNQSLVRNDDGSFSILTGDDYQGDGSSNEVIGSQANDTIDGGAGNDILRGAGGNDTLTGGLGADTFAWHLGDEDALGTPAIDTAAIDTVTDFDASEGDMLDLSDLLQNKEEDEAIADYLRAADDGSGTVLHVSSAGSLSSDPASTDQTIKLAGVDMGGKSSEAFIDDLVGKGQIDI